MRISDWSSDVCSSDLVICLVAEIGPALRGDPDAVDIDDIQRIISDPRSIGNVERIILSPQESVRAAIKFLCAALGGDAFGHDGPEIGRASCRERVCHYVSILVFAVSFKKTLFL